MLACTACGGAPADIQAWTQSTYDKTCYEPLECERLRVTVIATAELTDTDREAGLEGQWCVRVSYRQQFPGQQWEQVEAFYNLERRDGLIGLSRGKSLCP